MKFTRKTLLAIMTGALLASPAAIAADHTDGSQAQADPAADITDVFTWMSDSATLTMIMDVNKAASSAAPVTVFSNVVKYVFHTAAHGPPAPGSQLLPLLGGSTDPEVDVICTFAGTTAPQTISCWVTSGGTTLDYVTGTASMDPTSPGLSSADGSLTVYAGLAADPFFFNIVGFENTVASVTAAKGALTFDAAGCPSVVQPTLGVLDGELTSGVDGGTPTDSFAGLNVNAIVIQLDQSLFLSQSVGFPAAPTDTLVSVWASTNN